MKQTHAITVAQYLHSFSGYPGLRDELIGGKIFMTDLPRPLYQHVQQNLFRLLHSACQCADYTVSGSSNILFPASNSAPSPDVFVVETSRWKEAIENDTYIDGPPLLVVERLWDHLGSVLPDENLREKISFYSKEVVVSLWVIDPERRIVRVYSGSEEHLYGKHTEINLPFPLSGSVRIDDIFFGLPESISYNSHFWDVPPFYGLSDDPALRGELTDGGIVTTHLPKPLHRHVEQNLFCLLHSACKSTDYTANCNTHLFCQTSDSAPYPDVFVVETSRWIEAIREDWYVDGPPLLAVEVLSPFEDVSGKVNIYLNEGVASIWVIDPKRRIVMVYSSSEKRQYYEHSEISLPFPLNGSVRIDDIFLGLPESVFYNKYGESENITRKDTSTQEHAITVAHYLHSFKGYPAKGVHDELINGRILISTLPTPLHAVVCQNILDLLRSERTDYIEVNRTNILFPASNSAPCPDVYAFDTSRLSEAMRKSDYLEVPPLLVVEVLSPSEDLSEKISLYSKEGVASIWVVDIPSRTVMVYSGSEMRPYAEHTKIKLPFPLKGSVAIDDIFDNVRLP